MSTLLEITRDAFAENVEALLTRRGMSWSDLQRTTGISQPHLSDLRQRKAFPSLRTICRICAALDASPEKMLRRAKNPA